MATRISPLRLLFSVVEDAEKTGLDGGGALFLSCVIKLRE